jgi:hypothetical protein
MDDFMDFDNKYKKWNISRMFLPYEYQDFERQIRSVILDSYDRNFDEYRGFVCYTEDEIGHDHSEIFDSFYKIQDFENSPLKPNTYVHIANRESFESVEKFKPLGWLSVYDIEDLIDRLDWFESYSKLQNRINPERIFDFSLIERYYESGRVPYTVHPVYQNLRTYEEVNKMHDGWVKNSKNLWVKSQCPDPSNVKIEDYKYPEE